jgi:selenide,water dikinase
MPEWKRHLLSDPQTSGGLLVSCAADRAASILQTITAAGFPRARIIGKTEAGKPSIKVI